MDSLLFGDQDEESTVPESVLKNLLVEVCVLYGGPSTAPFDLDIHHSFTEQPPGGGGEPGTAAADSSNRPLYQFVIPEAGEG